MRRFLLSAGLAFGAAVAPAAACELRLMLSWDVSASMSRQEYEVQRSGTAAAFRSQSVMNAIALSSGGVSAAVVQWAGAGEQTVSVPWTLLRSARDAEAFADRVAAMPRLFGGRNGTAIGSALKHAGQYLSVGGPPCARSVIDISGDGVSNAGIATAPQADDLAAAAVTINGLVMTGGKVKRAEMDPFIFYVRNVVRGPGAFVMDVHSYTDFPRAMQRKLLREILMQTAELEPPQPLHR